MRLSILIATHDRRELVRRCLDALREQTEPPSEFEVVVIVDGSRDGTLELLRAYKAPYRLLVEHQESSGKAVAINHAAAVASAPRCLLLDDDVIAGPNLVREHLRIREERAGVVAVGPLHQRTRPGADGLTRWFHSGWIEHYERLARAPDRLTYRDCYGGNISFPRRAFLEVGGFATDLSRGFDVDLGYRLERHGLTIVFTPDAVATEHLTKGFREVARDAERAGVGMVSLYRKHPATLPDLGLGRFRELTARSFLARELLLRINLSPRLLAWTDPLLRRLPGSSGIYATIFSYFLWRGVKRALGNREAWLALRRGTMILAYSTLAPGSKRASRSVVSRRAFAWQMRWLKLRGYSVMSLDEYVRERLEHRLPRHRSVVVTFDGGYRDALEVAYPILTRLELPATVFLATGAVGRTNDWSSDEALRGRRLLTWEEAKRLEAGGLRFGIQGRARPALGSLSLERAAGEIAESRAELESNLGPALLHFAYAWGDSGAGHERLVQEAGFHSACGSTAGSNTPATPLYALRRVHVRGELSLMGFVMCTGYWRRLHLQEPG